MWPKAVSVIKELKHTLEDQEEPYVLVDIGDHMDRSHPITEGTLGQVNIDLLNQLSYDYITIGNNEGITFPKAVLDNMYERAEFNVLVNNLFYEDGGRPPWLAPFQIIQCGRLKIGLLGTTIPFNQFYKMLGWQIEHPIEAIRRDLEHLKGKVDFIVLLSHLGLPQDEKLLEENEDIQLILGAHTHHVLYRGKKVRDRWIAQCGRSGHYVGHVSVEWEDTLFEPHFSIQAQCIPTENHVSDHESLQTIEQQQHIASQYLSEPIAEIKESLDINWYGESTLGNMLAESLNDWCQADFSLVNAGQILDDIDKGEVTKYHVHQICPHPINPCVVTLSGKEVYAIIRKSLSEEFQQKEIKGFGFRGKVLGSLCLDGIEVIVNKDRSHIDPDHIRILYHNEPLDPEQTYRVATIDMFTFGRMYPEISRIDKSKVQYFLPEFLRDILAVRLQRLDLERARKKRWHIT